MDKKQKDRNQSPKPRHGQPTLSQHNPNAAARRRLLRTLGGSGGAALATILAGVWHTPVVKSVMLPAHAQMSPGDSNPGVGIPPGCPISVSVTLIPVACVPAYSATAIVSDSNGITELGNVAVNNQSTTFDGSANFPTGTYNAGVSASGAFGTATGTFAVECCDATEEAGFSVFPGSTLRFLTLAVTGDGECGFST